MFRHRLNCQNIVEIYNFSFEVSSKENKFLMIIIKAGDENCSV